MDLGNLGEAAVRGAVVGLGSGLLALALVLTFRSTGVLNLALGGIASFSAFVVWGLWTDGSVGLGFAIAAALAVAAGLGFVGERALRPLAGGGVVVRAVGSLGLLLVLQATITLLWDPSDHFLGLLISRGTSLGNIRLGWQQLLTAGLALVALGAVLAWVRWFPSGMASLAVAEDPAAARLLGIRPTRVASIVWVISALLAGLAGILLSGLTVLNSSEMTLALVTSLAAALVAGFDRVELAVGGAALVGSVTAMAASIDAVSRQSGLVESLGFIVVVLLIVFVRPRQAVGSLGRA